MLKRIGRYKIIGTLGKGAMGVVYKARDTKFDRIVAVKTISGVDGLSEKDREEFTQRFLQEAHAAGNLSHPNIVGIYDADQDSKHDISFITMEYVEGQSLEDLLAEGGALNPESALAIAIQVARGLGFAHQTGVVHRDIKPSNILLDAAGQVKLTDFGIAKVSTSKLTSTGQFLGTPGYMSPEQVFGDEIDSRSDLFSLAVVLYQMITGEMPFPGNNITTITYKIVNTEPPPPTHINYRLAGGFDTFLARGMAKSPDQRFQTADEMVGELERLIGDKSMVSGEEELSAADGGTTRLHADVSGVSPSTVVASTMIDPTPALPAAPPAPHEGKRTMWLTPGQVLIFAVSGILGVLLLANAYIMLSSAGNTEPVVVPEAVVRPQLVKKYDIRNVAVDAASLDGPMDQTLRLDGLEFPPTAPPSSLAVGAAAANTVARQPEVETADEPRDGDESPGPEAEPKATLNLVLCHPFESGTLVVHASGKTVHEEELGPDDANASGFKKKMRALGRKLRLKRHHAKGIIVPVGSYDISLAIVRSEGSTPPLAILDADFEAGQERSLTVVCRRKSSAEMVLKWVSN